MNKGLQTLPRFSATASPAACVNLLLGPTMNSSNIYLTCGYLIMDVANKFGDIAATVTGINNLEETLDA